MCYIVHHVYVYIDVRGLEFAWLSPVPSHTLTVSGDHARVGSWGGRKHVPHALISIVVSYCMMWYLHATPLYNNHGNTTRTNVHMYIPGTWSLHGTTTFTMRWYVLPEICASNRHFSAKAHVSMFLCFTRLLMNISLYWQWSGVEEVVRCGFGRTWLTSCCPNATLGHDQCLNA